MKQITAIIPTHVRKKVRFGIEAFFGKKIILDEIKISDLPKNQKTVFFFGITTWDYRFQRTQHIATGLAKKGYQVIFVEPDFLVTNNLTTPPFELIQLAKNLYKVRLSGSKNLFIYSELPSTQNLAVLLKSFNRLVAGYQIRDLVAVVTHPFWTPLVKSINCPVIYDCMDYHAGFNENSRTVLEQENQLYNLANKVVVTSEFLRKQALGYTKAEKIYLIPNGGDYETFSIIPDKKQSNELTIGYVGAINQRINVTLLSQLAPLCDHLVLGGQVDNPEVMALSRRYSSVSLLGEVPSYKLAQVISAFDICLIPYLISDFTKAIYPSKLMDYLATGKPVIATPLPELIPFSELVYIIDNKVELKSIVDTAWHESEDIRKKRRQVAAQNSWQRRAEAFIELL